MIEQVEIDAKSEELGVHVSHVQRDYVFGWLLAGLFEPANPLARRLSLKGGNAFRKAYFEKARYSSDLDFSIQTELREDDLRRAVVAASAFAGERSGVDFRVADTRIDSRQSVDAEGLMYEARVYFRSFYGDDDATIRVNLDVKEFDRVLLPIQDRALIHSYSDAAPCAAAIRTHKLEELLASKLVALLHRQHSPDLFDFVHSVFFQKALDVNRLQIVTTFLKKTIYERTPQTVRGLLLDLPFAVFRGFWKQYLVCPRDNVIEFDAAEQSFRSVIAELFALLTPQPAFAVAGAPVGAPTYYSSDARSTILEAGRLQRIIRLAYDGYERRVEPYALVFKRPKDGTAHEYFYGWDLSGGRSGEVGIKSFFANKVASVRMTEESFDPKYPIELTKGSSTGYFARSSFASSPTRSARRSTSSVGGARYTIECPYCGKQFKRTQMDTKLNEHKDRFGNRCFGRVGFVAGMA
jgi:predicted nucleotidyltransferase component of viral defense system